MTETPQCELAFAELLILGAVSSHHCSGPVMCPVGQHYPWYVILQLVYLASAHPKRGRSACCFLPSHLLSWHWVFAWQCSEPVEGKLILLNLLIYLFLLD